MKTIKKFFCEFDFYSAPATLRIRQQPEMKTCTIGFISLSLAVFFIYVFINSSIQVLNFQKISFTSSRTTVKSNEANGHFRMFGVNVGFMDVTQFNDIFSLKTYAFKNGVFHRQITMRPCVPEDWSQLGENYTQDFKSYSLQSFYCPDTTQNFTLNDTFRSDNPDFVVLFLSACNVLSNPSCDVTKTQQYIQNQTYQYSVVDLNAYILDIAIQPDKQKPISHFINIDTKLQFTTTFGGGATVQFSSFDIKTDVNIFPWEIIDTQSGQIIDTVRNFQIGLTDPTVDTLGVIYFTMNQKKFLIERKVGKVDQLLSYAGGLFSLIIGFFGFFLLSYNEYKYQLTVAEGVFKNDDEIKVCGQDDLHIWTYIKYSIFDWVNALTCKQICWKDCKDINQTRDQIINHLEADRILRRLNKIENTLKLCLSQQEELCSNLIGPPRMDNAKNNRLALDYYSEITNGRCPLTLQDINQSQDRLKSYLKIDQRIFTTTKIGTQFQVTAIESYPKIQQSFNQPNGIFGAHSRIVWQDDDRLNIIWNILDQYPEIKKQAESIVLDEQFLKLEAQISESFFRIREQVRVKMQEKIPILVLYRLLLRKMPQKIK